MTDFKAIQQKYYEHREVANTHFGGQIDDIENYVNALEERETAMIEVLKRVYDSIYPKHLVDYVEKTIESITGQSIEEVMKR